VIGEVLAICTALCWATSPVIYRKTLVGVDLVVANLARAVPATMLLVMVFLGSGGLARVLTLDLRNLLLIIASVVTGQVLGDLLLFRSIIEIGASRSSAIFSTHPLFSMLLAFLLLNETPSWIILLGGFAIVAGLWLINLSMAGGPKAWSTKSSLSMLKALLGAGLWGSTTLILKIVVRDVSPLDTITLRMIVLSVILLLMIAMSGRMVRLKRLKKTDVYMLGLAGVVALALGNFLLYTALKLVGLSVAAPLSSVAPLFTTLFAVVFLKERVSGGQLIGMMSIFIGTLILMIF